jgi:hypothetical protein
MLRKPHYQASQVRCIRPPSIPCWANGSSRCGIKTGGDDDEFRLERLGGGQLATFKKIARYSSSPSPASIGTLIVNPSAGADAPLRRPTRAGIMRILVRAEEENRRILFKAMLRTVSVMHIPVDVSTRPRPYCF